MPLHNIQVRESHFCKQLSELTESQQKWTGFYFAGTTLQALGMKVHLGHAPGRFCEMRRDAKTVTVVHSNGVHEVDVHFCQCDEIPEYRQLLQIGWYPATPLQPQSCATLEALRHFHLLNLQGKLPAYSYYKATEYETDTTGLAKPPVRLSFKYPFVALTLITRF